MRIAFLTTEFITEDDSSGGLSNYLVRIALGLLSNGHFPVVFVRSHVNERTEYKGIPVIRVRPEPDFLIKAADKILLTRFKRPLRNLAFSKACWKVLSAEHEKAPFAIVQAASYAATALYAPKGVPVVVRLSSIESLWRKASGWPFSLPQWLIEYFEGRAIKKADGVFAPSTVIAEKAQKMFGVSVGVIEPTFIMTQSTPPIKEECRISDPYLIFYGTVGRLKGCDVIAEALPEFFRRHPSLSFVFAGNGDSREGVTIVNRLRTNAGAFAKNIIVIDGLPHARLFPLIRNAEAVVLPSLIDNLPNTCIEAMSMGKTVIGTRGASFEQLIDDGVSGFLAEPGDPGSLLDAIDRALSLDAAQKDELERMAAQRIEKLAPDITLPRLLRFYEKVIADRKVRKR